MSPSVRIGLCLVMLTTSLLIAADFFFEILPDQTRPLKEVRKRFCESLAVQFSAFAERDDRRTMQRTMESIVNRGADVVSVGLRLSDGTVVASSEGHIEGWLNPESAVSTPTQVRVPIFNGEKPWGTVEVHFEPLQGAWHEMLLASPLARLIVIVVTGGFVLYTWFMRRTLRYLDPSSVVPGRVQTALDQLVEGVVLVDPRLHIVLANDAFAQKLDSSPGALMGKHISELDWGDPPAGSDGLARLPWERVRDEGHRVTEVRLTLATPRQGVRVLTSNVSPIVDGFAKQQGMLLSFDDISQIERSNQSLRETISQLKEAENSIREKNVELVRLASVDPLTDTLNRRAFFEKIDAEFALARKNNLELSCIMADIDHFKSVNDTYGHAVGDEVIKGIALILNEHCPPNGAVGRYGGEEFCIVLPGVSLSETMLVANRIRLAFRTWSKGSEGPTAGKSLTASFGASAVNFGAADAAAMVDQADQALYHSKTNGRNRATSFADCDDRTVAEAS